MEDLNILEIGKDASLTYPVFTELKKNYKGLEVNTSNNCEVIKFDTTNLESSQIGNLEIDIEFKLRNPNLPLENLCCNFSNYIPKTPSQEALLDYAQKLTNLELTEGSAGLFIYGDPGIGKTHIAVSITKELMSQRQEAHYVNSSKINRTAIERELGSNQAWILDDLNSPYSAAMDIFKKMVLNAHNNGGRIVVTSNTTYDELMEHGFVTDQNEKQRFMDRIQGMFGVLEVKGKSKREKPAWFQIPKCLSL